MDPTRNEQSPLPTPPTNLISNKSLLIAAIGGSVLLLFFGVYILLSNLKPSSGRVVPPKPTPTSIPLPTEYKVQAEHQAEADRKYGEYWSSIEKQYPWYDKLPLQTDVYFVYFDPAKKTMIGKIYSSKSSVSVDQIKQMIESRLQGIGVDTTKYKVSWQIQ